LAASVEENLQERGRERKEGRVLSYWNRRGSVEIERDGGKGKTI